MTDADRWAKKYYPVPADKVKKKDAVAHSIRKWSGLSAAVRKRFGIVLDDTEVHFLDESEFVFDTNSCALCAHYCDFGECPDCPLVKAGFSSCCDIGGPYGDFLDGDPRPMQRALAKAKRYEDKAKAKP